MIAFNFGAASLAGHDERAAWRVEPPRDAGSTARGAGSAAAAGLAAFLADSTSEKWLGAWAPAGYRPDRGPGETRGVQAGADAIGAPAGGFRRGASDLAAALRVAFQA